MSSATKPIKILSFDDDTLKDRNSGTVNITRNGKVLELGVHSIHDDEMQAIYNFTKPPYPPTKKVARTDERGKPMMDPVHKRQIWDEVKDENDPVYLEKVAECERKRHMLIVVRGIDIDWGAVTADDKRVDLLAKKFSGNEIAEILSTILRLGIVDYALVEAEKNESSQSEETTEQDGSAESTS